MARITHVHCPVCEFRLRGTAHEGYRCVRCHARYSTRFVRQLRRRQFSQLIHRHFVRVERQETLVEEPTLQVVQETITVEVPAHDDYLDLTEIVAQHTGPVPPTSDEPRIATPTLPEYKIGASTAVQKPVRQAVKRRSPPRRVAKKVSRRRR